MSIFRQKERGAESAQNNIVIRWRPRLKNLQRTPGHSGGRKPNLVFSLLNAQTLAAESGLSAFTD